jgi:3-dehydroquinate synthase
MPTLTVPLGPRSYPIEFSGSGFAAFARRVAPRAKVCLVVGDTNVEQHVRSVRTQLESVGFAAHTSLIPAGEQSKNLFTAAFQYDKLADIHADRSTLVVAVGGGVVGDLAGFVASTYNRGLPLLMVPTTLLAMVDSSVGGKVGVNHPKGKNLIGAFHQPAGVWIDTAYLHTLPEREFRSGLAEVIKYGVILDADFFGELEEKLSTILAKDTASLNRIIQRSCELKAQVVSADEREETGLRAVLNYGHTFAHAFETVGGYGTWLHGEAVAAGMVCASILAERLGRIDPTVTERQRRLIEQCGLPTAPKPEWNPDELIAVMRRDKKAVAGELRFVLPTRLGHVELVDGVSERMVKDVLLTRKVS